MEGIPLLLTFKLGNIKFLCILYDVYYIFVSHSSKTLQVKAILSLGTLDIMGISLTEQRFNFTPRARCGRNIREVRQF